MPPHCDSMDGPVVTAARKALQMRDVEQILPYVKRAGETEVREAFERTLGAHNGSPAVNELVDLYFYETVVRVHRAGEGAPYTGLKPAGLSVGPVIPVAERAIETGDAGELTRLLTDTVVEQVERRFADVLSRHARVGDGVEAAREYVEAMLGLQVWSHKVYESLQGGAHEGEGGEVHSHG